MSNPSPKPQKKPVNRFLVGLIALGCLGTGVYIWQNQPEDKDSMLWAAGFIRAGSLMAAFWLALPTKKRPAAWANMSKARLAGVIFAIGAMAAKPRMFVPLFGILAAVMFFLRPGRSRHRPRRDSWE